MKRHSLSCNEVREHLVEMTSAKKPSSPEVARHLAECTRCAGEAEAWNKTWALMDEWVAPEPSPYFNTRLQAKFREEKLTPQRAGVLDWLRLRWQPVAAMALTVALAIGITLYNASGPTAPPKAQITDAVSDLQALDKNADVYNFDLLFADDEQQQQQTQ
jgi:anti-sigma factor RsiW